MEDSEKRLAEIEEKASSAAEGPWFTNSYGEIFSTPRTHAWTAAEDEIPEDAADDDPRWQAVTALEDAAHIAWMAKGADSFTELFIADSRADIDWLIARVKELEKQNKAYGDFVDLLATGRVSR